MGKKGKISEGPVKFNLEGEVMQLRGMIGTVSLALGNSTFFNVAAPEQQHLMRAMDAIEDKIDSIWEELVREDEARRKGEGG